MDSEEVGTDFSKSSTQDLSTKDFNGNVSATTSENKRGVQKRQKNDADVAVPYTEPEWSSSPPPNYKFEVIKGGKIISDIFLNTPYLTIGRLQNCNIALEHPSVSRYHAVLQYCPGDSTRLKGFYVYDLGSTHGTFLNKKQVTAKVYYKLEVGHILKFGGSTRLHIFQGPDDDANEEQASESEIKTEPEICDWGLGEDADEEEDLTVNPFALSTANEELYLDDPKKTLRGWFEREGYELEYDVEEKGFRTFVCRVQLPIDTLTGEYPFAEASVNGKKKEAVLACAMEACRILDRHGVLRQARHENRRKKRKNWEDEDFYDSDEDTYLDRTGAIEKKREIRKKIAKKSEAETFQSLSSKLESVSAEISEIERKIHNCAVNFDSQSDDEKDSLETYMSQIEGPSGSVVDKVTKSKLKLRLSELLREKGRLEKLLDVARPTALPPISKTFGMIGKRPTKKFQLPATVKTPTVNKSKMEENEEEVEEDSDSDDGSSIPKQQPPAQESVKNNTGEIVNEAKVSRPCEKSSEELADTFPKKVPRMLGANNLSNSVAEKPQKSTDAKGKAAKSAVKADVYRTNDSDYSMWVPPKNQTGDGTTHLNAKYGY